MEAVVALPEWYEVIERNPEPPDGSSTRTPSGSSPRWRTGCGCLLPVRRRAGAGALRRRRPCARPALRSCSAAARAMPTTRDDLRAARRAAAERAGSSNRRGATANGSSAPQRAPAAEEKGCSSVGLNWRRCSPTGPPSSWPPPGRRAGSVIGDVRSLCSACRAPGPAPPLTRPSDTELGRATSEPSEADAIECLPCPFTVRAWWGDELVAESPAAVPRRAGGPAPVALPSPEGRAAGLVPPRARGQQHRDGPGRRRSGVEHRAERSPAHGGRRLAEPGVPGPGRSGRAADLRRRASVGVGVRARNLRPAQGRPRARGPDGRGRSGQYHRQALPDMGRRVAPDRHTGCPARR